MITDPSQSICRLIIHEQLVAAKRYLWDGHTYPQGEARIAICDAIDVAFFKHGRHTSGNLARPVITERLGRYSYVFGWLYGNVPEFEPWLEKMNAQKRLVERDTQIQAYRLRWLESLIEEYK